MARKFEQKVLGTQDKKPHRPIRRGPQSEFFTRKYDDISREERAILAQMTTDHKKNWNINDFRAIPSFRNDGKQIGDILSNLSMKKYIKRTNTGWKLWHIASGSR